MATSIVLTIIGEDRTGIVASLSDIIAAHGGNWQQSSLGRLGGQFAGVVLASVPDDQLVGCLQALDALEQQGLTVISHSTMEGFEEQQQPQLRMELVGNDVPGIVRELTAVLRAHDVSVEHLETRVESASMAGGELFRANALLRLPEGGSVEDLRSAIEAISFELMLELHSTDGAES
jgi:glycine cleavage system regulatory protein